jgi:hypothetical protein
VSITTDLDAIRDRWDQLIAVMIDDLPEDQQLNAAVISASDVPFLLDLVDELRRQVQVWKGKAEWSI